jgi:transcriptional regulator with XRE-family HTH domain
MPFNNAYMKRRREQLKLTLEQAANAAGFKNRQNWYAYETGRLPNPNLLTIEAIAKAIGCKTHRLILDP